MLISMKKNTTYNFDNLKDIEKEWPMYKQYRIIEILTQ